MSLDGSGEDNICLFILLKASILQRTRIFLTSAIKSNPTLSQNRYSNDKLKILLINTLRRGGISLEYLEPENVLKVSKSALFCLHSITGTISY